MVDEEQFKDKTTEWRGYTLRALEDINRELGEVKTELKACNTKIDELNNRLTGVQIKMAGISATVSIMVSIVLWFITKV